MVDRVGVSQSDAQDRASPERQFSSGLLGATSRYRLVVSGRVGVRELERLIARLRLEQDAIRPEDDPYVWINPFEYHAEIGA
jgi:hypothetical protein